ncbi:MAG: AbrB/MazE/SpoVT family DNA-binding domain-containing protein [Thiomargarita sp.]|nr:AbrB/MazE/SpoVT family DNA-binding domain-containing protein [Thiomargarita sp.]
MENITLSPNFLVSIPENIVKQLHLQVGQQLTCIAKEGNIQLIPQRDIQSIRGIFEGANPENYRDRAS